VDIEGGEFPALSDILAYASSAHPAKIEELMFEVHQNDRMTKLDENKKYHPHQIGELIDFFRKIDDAGYLLSHKDENAYCMQSSMLVCSAPERDIDRERMYAQ
jgi:hypothetical protein